jgi:hypothetical protein
LCFNLLIRFKTHVCFEIRFKSNCSFSWQKYCQRLMVWLIADFGAITYQGTTKFDESYKLKTAMRRQLTIPCVGGSFYFINPD